MSEKYLVAFVGSLAVLSMALAILSGRPWMGVGVVPLAAYLRARMLCPMVEPIYWRGRTGR